MGSLLDLNIIGFSPHKKEGHKSIALGAALADPYMPPHARSILIQATGDDVRFTLDGTAPTATFGFRLFADGFPLKFEVTNNFHIQFFGETANSIIQYCWGE